MKNYPNNPDIRNYQLKSIALSQKINSLIQENGGKINANTSLIFKCKDCNRTFRPRRGNGKYCLDCRIRDNF